MTFDSMGMQMVTYSLIEATVHCSMYEKEKNKLSITSLFYQQQITFLVYIYMNTMMMTSSHRISIPSLFGRELNLASIRSDS